MSDYPIFNLNLVNSLGSNLYESLVEAKRISIVLGVTVRFDFNQYTHQVWPKRDVDEYYKRFILSLNNSNQDE